MSNEKHHPDFLNMILQKQPDQRLFRQLVTGMQSQPDSHIFIPDTALPKGYAYRPLVSEEYSTDASIARGLKTVAFHAHPSDISGDFLPYIFLLEKGREGAEFQPVILSMGEASKARDRAPFNAPPEGMSKEDYFVEVRIKEEQAACDVLGMPYPHYLTNAEGKTFPDGGMMQHLSIMKDSMKQYIREHQPERIVRPSPYPDHADHLATYISGMNAILELQQEGYFKEHGKIEILACEPEFGVTKGRKAALNKIPQAFGGNLQVEEGSLDGLVHPRYYYHLDAITGKISPAHDITQQASGRKVQSLEKHTIAAAPYIVALSDEMVALKVKALEHHQTQVGGTNYEEGIMSLDHLRGAEVGAQWGVGIYPIKIPEVTLENSPFLDNLNPSSVFQLEKSRNQSKAVESSARG